MSDSRSSQGREAFSQPWLNTLRPNGVHARSVVQRYQSLATSFDRNDHLDVVLANDQVMGTTGGALDDRQRDDTTGNNDDTGRRIWFG